MAHSAMVGTGMFGTSRLPRSFSHLSCSVGIVPLIDSPDVVEAIAEREPLLQGPSHHSTGAVDCSAHATGSTGQSARAFIFSIASASRLSACGLSIKI